MKKFLALIFSLALVLTLVACAPPEEEEQTETYEIALVTDVGTIDDKSFNQGAWEGVKRYADENQISYTYYQPADKTTDDYVRAIELAIENGAKVVVAPGFLFENAIYIVQTEYPDVHFILLDGAPHNVTDWGDDDTPPTTLDGSDPDFTIEDNVSSIFYTEHESGYLAGFAAVKDGYTKLGFIGGMAVPAVQRFGYGYIEGANAAAAEDGKTVDMKYYYAGVFWPTDGVRDEAGAWYQSGTEVIFVAAGGAGSSVMNAAESASGTAKVIGVDVDQSNMSTTVITSAKKELANSVYDTLEQIYNETVEGGKSTWFNAGNNGIGLPDDFSRFNTFTKADYDELFAKLVSGDIDVSDDISKTLAQLDSEYANVNIEAISE